jgi:hypothetical protein
MRNRMENSPRQFERESSEPVLEPWSDYLRERRPQREVDCGNGDVAVTP